MTDLMVDAPPSGARYPSLAGKRVIVSGGGSGIGEGIVEGFARQGAAVAFVDIQTAPSEALVARLADAPIRSEEHTSELQSLMRISYAVFCLKKKNKPRNK